MSADQSRVGPRAVIPSAKPSMYDQMLLIQLVIILRVRRGWCAPTVDEEVHDDGRYGGPSGRECFRGAGAAFVS